MYDPRSQPEAPEAPERRPPFHERYGAVLGHLVIGTVTASVCLVTIAFAVAAVIRIAKWAAG